MPEKPITCSDCAKPLGIIFKARLKKNISFLCDNCETKRKVALMRMEENLGIGKNDVYSELMDTLFGSSRK